MTEQDRQNRTVRTGQAELDSRTRPAEQDRKNRTCRKSLKGLPERAVRTGLPGTGLPGHVEVAGLLTRILRAEHDRANYT